MQSIHALAAPRLNSFTKVLTLFAISAILALPLNSGLDTLPVSTYCARSTISFTIASLTTLLALVTSQVEPITSSIASSLVASTKSTTFLPSYSFLSWLYASVSALYLRSNASVMFSTSATASVINNSLLGTSGALSLPTITSQRSAAIASTLSL